MGVERNLINYTQSLSTISSRKNVVYIRRNEALLTLLVSHYGFSIYFTKHKSILLHMDPIDLATNLYYFDDRGERLKKNSHIFCVLHGISGFTWR